MKKQTLSAHLHEHLGAAHKGPHKESMAMRTKESKGEEKAMHHGSSHALKSHDHHKSKALHHHAELKKHIAHLHKMAKAHKAK